MKLKSIAQLCKASKTILLYDMNERLSDVEQWVGNGFAAYPLAGVPYLEETGLLTIFDITEKQRKKITFSKEELPKRLCFDDSDDGEEEIELGKMAIQYADRMLIPTTTRDGLTFIDGRYLQPIADVEESLFYFDRRTPDGKSYIAVKAGFILVAIIMPYDAITPDMFAELEKLTLQCAHALRIKEQRDMKQDTQIVFVDRDTGEAIDQ